MPGYNTIHMPRRIEWKCNPEEAANLQALLQKVAAAHSVPVSQVLLRKKSLDARSRNPHFLFHFDILSPGETIPPPPAFRLQHVANRPEVHIVGFGPAGIFAALQCIEAGYKPVVIERGKSVRDRRRDLAELNRSMQVNPESNYCFGEGGAGTYSDGKLYTRSDKRGPVQQVLQTLVQYGAAENILWDAHPHIGTNKLPGIIENLRQAIVDAGGEVHFQTKLTGLVMSSGKIASIQVNGNALLPVSQLILATGHSARDVFELLHQHQIAIEAKPFAIGVRLEHPQALIDSIQYKCPSRGPWLPPSSYSLVEQVSGRGVFSFCMCPGGIIAPAATAPGEVVVNGWSPSKRNGRFANSGFVVSVDEADFKPFAAAGPLSAMQFQSHYEQKAFAISNSLKAPAQRLEDFIQNRFSNNLPDCSYIPGIVPEQMAEVLPTEVSRRIREALVVLGKKMPAFRTNEAVLVGVESRTSSPVRIPRNKETLQHPQVANLYPCAEGAGYAGGIMSAALDGIRVVQAMVQTTQQI